MERKTTETNDGAVAHSVTGDPGGEVTVLLPGFQSDQTSWSGRGYAASSTHAVPMMDAEGVVVAVRGFLEG